jgi:hypothetical protein
MSISTQCEQILAHLKERPITPLEALDLYGCFRLGARVFDLKRDGFDIQTEIIERNGKRFAQYTLNEKRPEGSKSIGASERNAWEA